MTRLLYLSLLNLVILSLVLGCGSDGDNVTNNYITPTPIQIESASVADGEEGTLYSETLTASGGAGSFTWTLEAGGANHAWLAIDTAGVLAGTPAAGDVGPVVVVVKVQ